MQNPRAFIILVIGTIISFGASIATAQDAQELMQHHKKAGGKTTNAAAIHERNDSIRSAIKHMEGDRVRTDKVYADKLEKKLGDDSTKAAAKVDTLDKTLKVLADGLLHTNFTRIAVAPTIALRGSYLAGNTTINLEFLTSAASKDTERAINALNVISPSASSLSVNVHGAYLNPDLPGYWKFLNLNFGAYYSIKSLNGFDSASKFKNDNTYGAMKLKIGLGYMIDSSRFSVRATVNYAVVVNNTETFRDYFKLGKDDDIHYIWGGIGFVARLESGIFATVEYNTIFQPNFNALYGKADKGHVFITLGYTGTIFE